MTAALIPPRWITDLGWTLILCFFFSAVIVGGYAVVQAIWRSDRAVVRFRRSCLALLAIGVSPAVIGWRIRTNEPIVAVNVAQWHAISAVLKLEQVRNGADVKSPALAAVPNGERSPSPSILSATFQRLIIVANVILALLVLGWAGYAVSRSGFLLWYRINLPKKCLRVSTLIEPRRAEQFERVAVHMGVRQHVQWYESASVPVPTVIGWRRPIVLLPANVNTLLSPDQLLLVVAHELAHIRRCDQLVAYVQTAVETVLFYHRPQLRWLAKQLETDREFCCDDLAARKVPDRRLLGEALKKLLTSIGGLSPDFMLAVTGNNVLEVRIERLLRSEPRLPASYRRKLLITGIATLILAAVILPALLWTRNRFKPIVDIPVHNRTLNSKQSEIDSANYREVIVYQKTLSFEQLRDKDAESATIAIPPSGRIAFRHRLTSPEESFSFLIRPHRLGPVAIKVNSIDLLQPFMLLQWPGSDGVMQSNTDGGSGRSGDCFAIVLTTAEWIRCIVTAGNETPSVFDVSLWQPHVSTDIDADYIGPAASLLLLDDFARAQVPTRPNIQPPAIDFPTDIDTFAVFAPGHGSLTFTVNGYLDGLKPYLQLYDQFGKRIYTPPADTFDNVAQLSVHTMPEAGYHLAVMSRDQRSTGEYVLVVRFQKKSGDAPTGN